MESIYYYIKHMTVSVILEYEPMNAESLVDSLMGFTDHQTAMFVEWAIIRENEIVMNILDDLDEYDETRLRDFMAKIKGKIREIINK